MKLTRAGKPDISYEVKDCITSREAVPNGMFRKDGKIYKLLKYGDALRDSINDLKEKVPSPITGVLQGTLSGWEGARPGETKSVLVIEMKQVATDHFFQISKPGGEAQLLNWIAAQNDKETLTRIYRALCAGKMAKLTDPQAFYIPTASDPIVFIDLHAGAVECGSLDSAIAAAKAKLALLK